MVARERRFFGWGRGKRRFWLISAGVLALDPRQFDGGNPAKRQAPLHTPRWPPRGLPLRGFFESLRREAFGGVVLPHQGVEAAEVQADEQGHQIRVELSAG